MSGFIDGLNAAECGVLTILGYGKSCKKSELLMSTRRDGRTFVLYHHTTPFHPLQVSSNMPVGTRASNAEAHPGRIVLETQQVRRTRKQVDEDEARRKAVAIATRKEAEARHQASIEKIALTEDSIEQDEEEIQRHSSRPDLRLESTLSDGSVYKPPANPMDSETEDDSG